MQQPFSPNRRFHQNTVAGEVTGELPTAAYTPANRWDDAMPYREALQGWEGCIDAPMILPAGAVFYAAPRMIGEHEWEGAIVSRNLNRDRL